MILAIELLAAAQGIDFRRETMPGAQLGRGTQIAYDLIRARVPFVEVDTVLYPYINAVRDLAAGGELRNAVAKVIRVGT